MRWSSSDGRSRKRTRIRITFDRAAIAFSEREASGLSGFRSCEAFPLSALAPSSPEIPSIACGTASKFEELWLLHPEPERLLEHAVHVQVDDVAANRPALRRLRAGEGADVFALRRERGFGVLGYFGLGLEPCHFLRQPHGLHFRPRPGDDPVHRENLRSIGCEHVLLVLRILVARDDGELEMRSGGCRLRTGFLGRENSRAQKRRRQRDKSHALHGSSFPAQGGPSSECSPLRSRASGAAFLSVVPSGLGVSDEPACERLRTGAKRGLQEETVAGVRAEL